MEDVIFKLYSNIIQIPINQPKFDKGIQNIFTSINLEEFILAKTDKYYLLNLKDNIISTNEIFNNPSTLNIVSLSYNSHAVLFIKSNGECFISNGSSKNVDCNVWNGNLEKFADFSLSNSIKLSGQLNKKYLVKVACGEQHVVFLTHAGMVFSMGDNSKGQLGNGNKNNSTEPTMNVSLLNYRIIDVSVGADHNLALGTTRELKTKANTTPDTKEIKENILFVWGDNSLGQLGFESTQYLTTPKILEESFQNLNDDRKSNLPIKKISTGRCHSFILLESGNLYAMGSNEFNQISPIEIDKGVEMMTKPHRIKFNSIEGKEVKFIDVYSSAYSSVLVTEDKHLLIIGKINKAKPRILKIKAEVNMDEVKLVATDEKLIMFYLKNKKINDELIFEEIAYNEDMNNLKLTAKSSVLFNSDITKLQINDELNYLSHNGRFSYNDEIGNESLQDNDISKDFFPENDSTDDIMDPNVSFEQSIEELRSYISLVGISYSGETASTSLSFRPKNLPKKTAEEEEYHRRLVEDNRRRYIKSLKEKHDEEKRQRELLKIKKEKIKKLQKTWETEILPNWFNIKKQYNYLKKYFYEGIPANLRSKVWLLCIGNNFSITPEYYEIEVKKAIQILVELQVEENQANCNTNDTPGDEMTHKRFNIKHVDKEKSIKSIDLDIERTFSHLGIFKSGSPVSEDLREILRAFVASRPDIGYVQGLSFIAGMLLLNMDKYQAFVALINMTLNHNIISFYRFDELQIQKRLQIFKQIFYYNLPILCEHFDCQDILPEQYLIEWIMTLFSKNLNIDLAARIWDIYMLEGINAIYQAAIVILSHFEKKFLNFDYEDIVLTIKNLNNITFDEEQFVDSMKKVKFQDWIKQEIQKLNDEFIPIY